MQKDERTLLAQKVTWVGFFVNLVLTAFKLTAGIIGRSSAMVADAVHSLSDFITDVIVLVFIQFSGKERDSDHHYGHGKYETFATFLISVALLFVAVGIFWSGLDKIISSIQGQLIEQPTTIALVAAVASVIIKEALFWYTKIIGEKINNQAVIANGWHHRSDAFSSIGTTLGIGGAIYLGDAWRILDPIAGIIVSFFIGKVAFDIGIPSFHELLEKSLPNNIITQINEVIEENENIQAYHNLKTRKIGNIYAIDVHIKLNKDISFVRSHDIATEIEIKLRERFGAKTITNIHTEPFNG